MEATLLAGTQFAIIDTTTLANLIGKIEELKEQVKNIHTPFSVKLYTNSQLKELLGVGDKLIKKYRDDGLLGYTQIGDKYWYSDTDIQQFLQSNYYTPFAIAG